MISRWLRDRLMAKSRKPVALQVGAPAIVMVMLAAALVVTAAGCHTIEPEPMTLERNLLTVDNRSSRDWTDVELWLNTYYRVTTPSVPAHGRFQAPLDTFVAGYGQRFDFHRAQVRDVRLKARLPDGTPLELTKQFGSSVGLAGALGGKR